MKQFRKKPIVVSAYRYQGALDEGLTTQDGRVGVETLEGFMEASLGDYIIRGVKGEFYPCKPDVFEASYEEVTDG